MSKQVVIIGGVAGGASCAARLRRLDEKCEITLVERGPYISFANCGLPYHIGGVIEDRDDLLVQTAEGFTRRFRVKVLVRTEALSIDRKSKTVKVRDLEATREFELPYDQLVLSPGAEPVIPNIPGAKLPGVFKLRNMPDMDAILSHINSKKPKCAVVVGAGFIGVEIAENLRHLGLDVSLLELGGQVMPNLDPEIAASLMAELLANGVDVRTGVSLQKIETSDSGLVVGTSAGEELRAGLVIVSAGVRPETELAKTTGLELGRSGGIKVDRQMRTSDRDIFAVGDAVEIFDRTSGQNGRIPLAGPANRQGRLVADVICGREVSYAGALGTSVIKVFGLTAASTGLSEKQASRLGIEHRVAWIHGNSHAGYYPGASQLTLKLVFSQNDGRVLGAQGVGKDGVDKRIDVLATALASGMSVFDLEALDLCYAPPFSSAKDPVNHLAAVAAGMIRGDHPAESWDDLSKAPEDAFLLDVRTVDEFSCGSVEGAINIPLDDLRERLNELPRDREISVLCQIGLRGYLATRILVQNGFKARNLLGGYKLWKAMKGLDQKLLKPSGCGQRESARGCSSRTLDAIGLQCPGPILKTKQAIDQMCEGEVLEVVASDPGFSGDIEAWARSTGNELIDVSREQDRIVAKIRKGRNGPMKQQKQGGGENQTMVVFSGDLDRALAALIIATGGASMGRNVTLFFTFWGINILRKEKAPAVRKDLISKMFGMMMPRGASRAKLSKMNMGGLGTAMMRQVMNSKNVESLPSLITSAKQMGVKFVACQMSMDVMGIKHEELIDGVEIGGVASFLDKADGSGLSLFI